MVEVKGKGNIVARIVADSVSSVNKKRITTYELEYHRYIHSEFMTHRMFSRNAASSRAIPVSKMLENVRYAPATPIHWGANQAGMQADHECNNLLKDFWDGNSVSDTSAKDAWEDAAYWASNVSEAFSEAGYHKQIVNRLTEPFQMMKVVCTATEYENFFWLRNHEAAQPEIAELARCMWEAREQSVPKVLRPGVWHVPYYGEGCWVPIQCADGGRGGPSVDSLGHSLENALIISTARCAAVSYRKTDYPLDKCKEVYARLFEGDRCHASPAEHQALPMKYPNNSLTYVYDCATQPEIEDGVTHTDRAGNYWSGNFQGWIQHRQLIKDHVKW